MNEEVEREQEKKVPKKCVLGDISNQWNIPVAGILVVRHSGNLAEIGLSASYAH